MNKNLKVAIVISGMITIVGATLAYRDSAWGNLIWPGLILTLSVGLVNVHSGAPQSEFRVVMCSLVFSFLVYTGAIYLLLGWVSRPRTGAGR